MVLAYIFVVVFLAGALQALTGFGYALVAAPLLIFVMNPKDVVIFNLLISTVIIILMIYQTRGEKLLHGLTVLFVTSTLGAFIGTYILKIISDDILKIVIGAVLLSITLAMDLKMAAANTSGKWRASGAGLLGGILGATTSLGGPPIMLYMMSLHIEKEVVRANLSRYFLLGNIMTLSLFYASGNLQSYHFNLVLLTAIPAIVLGHVAGNKLFPLINARSFQKISVAIVLIGALVTICNGLVSFIK